MKRYLLIGAVIIAAVIVLLWPEVLLEMWQWILGLLGIGTFAAMRKQNPEIIDGEQRVKALISEKEQLEAKAELEIAESQGDIRAAQEIAKGIDPMSNEKTTPNTTRKRFSSR